ncbi:MULTISPECIES: glutamate formimidoyltransferase [unclassified Fusibacter]|uniref:glutamate formimidoyltransferase n=1 Tax=unclassified Fusibacter TaxID=2624464 RepID=UPI001010A53D|nr:MULTISPECIES: glutamate formimidoyltransferase [unclassified Fusibacter]MCK8060776.1 glutamate formimidoyltransferase [Fusibacter sp. A2]NPE23072.1 glutamate formimidoyltransferase [Fusibacter sp. A1]RXV59743.1 glutamate formimidoyltransferase [Fusibacter sp. A1]
MSKLVQCVPNFSEGRDLDKVEKILNAFRAKEGVKLLDYSSDKDHNRSVVTLVGEPQAVKKAVVEAVGIAKELIDMTKHEGQHPRMGACDVIPFIPIKNITIEECVALAKETAQEMNTAHGVPVFLYEKAASNPDRENLAKVRKGQFEGMFEKVKEAEWKLDFGTECHPTYGVTAVGARMPLVAFNVLLNTNNLDIANQIAKNVRHLSGGLRFVKGIGIDMPERNITQVSMNMTDFTKTPLYRAFELIKIEAKRYGVSVIGSEVIGLVPMEAMVRTAEWYLGVEDFSMEQVLEKRMME